MISYKTIENVKELSIVDVVSKYVELKKSGASYSAKSPFTNEKSASFFVVPAKGIFKCFSSGKGGDGITFVMEKLGVGYPDAIKELCAQFHIKIDYESNGHSKEYYDEIEAIDKINLSTARLYAKTLHSLNENHPAKLELAKRKFTADTIVQWQIGFAPGVVGENYTPAKWNFLTQHVINAGQYQAGIDAGVIKTKDNVNYDVFRNRLIFPINDHQGRCVGFGGRALNPDQYNAKYLNTGDGKVFNKSKILFGLNFAAQAIRKHQFALICEGFTDVISFHQAGIENTVGTCGTSLTEEQAKLLHNYTNKAVLVYDGDEAGQNAALRAMDILLKHGFQVYIVPMPSVILVKNKKKPTKKEPNPQPIRETVFIKRRDAETITCRQGTEDVTYGIDEIESIVKVDPDELVRMF
jgi:DNA primase